MTNEIENQISQAMYGAVAEGRVTEARQLLAKYPDLRKRGGLYATWLHDAAGYGNVEMIKMLVEEGMDVNAGGNTRPDGPLSNTLGKGHLAAARFLIEHGASPNVGRLLIGAMNATDGATAFDLVKLLVEHGADVNQCWRFGDEKRGPLFNALSWAVDKGREDIAAYLRAHGAVMPTPEPAKPVASAAEEMIVYFERQFGPVDRKALQEIVPSGDCPIAIHRVPLTPSRNSTILFSTGMSEKPMNVPDGGEDYRFAELFIELPAEWPLSKKALADSNNRWPIDWLRKIAAYPRQENTWLGGPFTIMANSDPPTGFSPKYRFTSMLLAADYEGVGPITLTDGRHVHVYTLVPLYEDERRLEQTHGLPELFRRMDQFEVSRRVNPNRPSVASGNLGR